MARDSCYEDANVKCPFFKKQTDVSISCEGIIGVHSVCLSFRKKSQKDVYLTSFCACNRYEQCQIYKEVNTKYEATAKIPQHKGH